MSTTVLGPIEPTFKWVESNWNVMAHSDTWEGKWRGNWQMEWVSSTLHTTSEHGVCSITIADAYTSAASSGLNWRCHQFKRTCPFRWKIKFGFCTCAITFQTQSTISYFPRGKAAGPMNLTTHLQLVPKLKMSNSIPILPPYGFTKWAGKTLQHVRCNSFCLIANWFIAPAAALLLCIDHTEHTALSEHFQM